MKTLNWIVTQDYTESLCRPTEKARERENEREGKTDGRRIKMTRILKNL